jgi:hypothetical protein
VALPVLLAARFGQVLGVVLGADDDLVRPLRAEQIGDVAAEGGVAAFVVAGVAAVDPDRGLVVDGAEAEHQPLAFAQRGCLEATAIPDRAGELLVADAAERRLRREGHADRPVEPNVLRPGEFALAIERELHSPSRLVQPARWSWGRG